ncbi:hypothetical protein ACRU3U_03475 [Aeromonas veronii]|uniref:hypothetical protein n=1 Tax=Aeromonas veronii TaxID=654 RepID=UPI003D7FA5EC
MSKLKRCPEEFKLAAVSLVLALYSPPSQEVGKPDSELELASKSRKLYRTTPVWLKCGLGGKRKRPLFLVAFRNSLILMVPEAGIEDGTPKPLKSTNAHYKNFIVYLSVYQ